MKLKRCQAKDINKEKKRRSFPTSALIVYLLIAVTLTTGVSFSRYTTSVSGSDSARVAKWDVEMMPQSNENIIMDGSNAADGTVQGSYRFTVASDSEVTVGYYIEIVFTTAPPSGVSLQVDSQTVQFADGNTKVFIFNGNQIAPRDTTAQQHELKIVGTLADLNTDFDDTVSVHVVTAQVD